MELKIGKIYEVRLGPKHNYSRIKAKYLENSLNGCAVEMIAPLKWNGSYHTVAFNRELKQKYGHGINFLVERKQILREVK